MRRVRKWMKNIFYSVPSGDQFMYKIQLVWCFLHPIDTLEYWFSGEPNDISGYDDCVAFSRFTKLKWGTEQCTIPRLSICEIDEKGKNLIT